MPFHDRRATLRAMVVARGLVALSILALVAAGCGDGGRSTDDREHPEARLIVGLIPEQNVFRQLDRYAPVLAYLTETSGVQLEPKVLPDYSRVLDGFSNSTLDAAFVGSFAFALAHGELGIDPIARPESLDGVSTYYGLVFVRRDLADGGFESLRGTRFAFVDNMTTAGYLLPLDYFRRNGVPDFRSFFHETYFAGTHEDAILDVLNGRAEAGAAKNTVFERLAAADPRVESELVVVARSPEVPENVLALRAGIDASIRERLERALLTMETTERGREILQRFGAGRFIETTAEDYAPVYEYADQVRRGLTPAEQAPRP